MIHRRSMDDDHLHACICNISIFNIWSPTVLVPWYTVGEIGLRSSPEPRVKIFMSKPIGQLKFYSMVTIIVTFSGTPCL